MSWRIRDNGRKVNVYDKVNSIKEDLKQILPEIEENRVLIQIMASCRGYYEKNRTKLTKTETIVYDYLLKNNINPATCYRWFLACRIPEDIKDKLSKGQISYRKAILISHNRRKVRTSNLGLFMMEEIREVIKKI